MVKSSVYTMRSAIPFSIWITDNDTNPADGGFFFNALKETKGKWKKKKIGQRGKVNKKTHVTDMPLQVQYCLVKAFSTLKTDHLTC